MTKTVAINVNHMTRIEGHGNIVVRASDGRVEQVEWQVEDSWLLSQSLAAGDEEVLYHNRKEVVCLDRKDGSERWRMADKNAGKKVGIKGNKQMLLIAEGKVILSSRRQVQALTTMM